MSLIEISQYDNGNFYIYSKGLFAVHMTRKLLGESEFRIYFKDFITRYACQPVGIREYANWGVNHYRAQVVDFYHQVGGSAGRYESKPL